MCSSDQNSAHNDAGNLMASFENLFHFYSQKLGNNFILHFFYFI